MALLEIDAKGVSEIEFKDYAPRAIDMNRVTGGNETFEDMEIKTRNSKQVRRWLLMRMLSPKRSIAAPAIVTIASARPLDIFQRRDFERDASDEKPKFASFASREDAGPLAFADSRLR